MHLSQIKEGKSKNRKEKKVKEEKYSKREEIQQ